MAPRSVPSIKSRRAKPSRRGFGRPEYYVVNLKLAAKGAASSVHLALSERKEFSRTLRNLPASYRVELNAAA